MSFDAHFVVSDATGKRLLLVPDGAEWRLPHWPLAEGPPERGQGFPVAVRAWVRERTGMDTVVLRWQNVEAPDTTRQSVYMLEGRGGVPKSGRWVARDELGHLALAEPHHRSVIESWFADDAPSVERPWRRVGWFDEAAGWIEERLGPGVQVTQWNTKGGCCLLRARTEAGVAAYFFKALPPMYAREPLVTRRLAELCLERVARVIAVDAGRRYLLTAECAGAWLPDVDDLRTWEAALQAMAELQIACVPLVDELLGFGCPDLRLHRLPGLLDYMLSGDVPRLLANDAAPSPWADVGMKPVELDALRSLTPRLREACRLLAGCGLPETLDHGDFHPGQVLVADTGPVFIDWSDSAISHPFFSMTRFLTYIRSRAFATISGAHDRLRDAYLEPWTMYAPMDRLREAAALAIPLGALEHALNAYLLDFTRDGVPWERSGAPATFLRLLLAHQW